MTFYSIVRQWCKIYPPMLDSSTNGNRRFYLTDSTGGVVDMAKSISDKFSPFVIMESAPDIYGDFLKPYRNYPIYFFVKAEKMADGDDAAAAYEEAVVHLDKFKAWLWDKHVKEMETNIKGDFAMMDLENSQVTVTPVGPVENGWYGICVQLCRMEPLNKCVSPDDYPGEE